ncbi:MAG: AMP-binding protein, partial [Deltaproteobacteria bacterium]|nr:AMP-binding protein [Deltaproteobacteria bacterium]
FDGFDALTGSIAHALIEAGHAPGDRVAIIASNSLACAATIVATWKAAGIVVPVNPALSIPELAYILRHATPRAIMADASKLDDVRTALGDSSSSIRTWLCDVPSPHATEVSALPGVDERWPAVDPVDVVALLYTSGTTGQPKGVMLTHSNFVFIQASWCEAIKLSPDDVVLTALPLFHVFPFVLLFISGLTAGAGVVIEKGFKFPHILQLMSTRRITVLGSVPPFYRALAALPWDRDAYDFSSLRVCISGGAPIAPATMDAARAQLGGAPIYDGYGITETSSIITIGPVGTNVPAGSCGKPVPGVRVEIRDASRHPMPTGDVGEIWAAGGGSMKGYYDDPVASAAVLVDGWYRTGDVGSFDADGFLYVADRIKDMIIVNGENVYPREIEAALVEHPDVAAAAVTRMLTDDTGEAPIAYVEPITGRTINTRELLGFLRQRLAPFKLPRKIHVVEQIPISAAGKILRRNLKA